MVKRISAAIAAVVLIVSTFMLSIGAEEAQTESAADPTKWDDVNVYINDTIASTMEHPELFNIGQWVGNADRSYWGQMVTHFYVNMVASDYASTGMTISDPHYLDKLYYDMILGQSEQVVDLDYITDLWFADNTVIKIGTNKLWFRSMESGLIIELYESSRVQIGGSDRFIRWTYTAEVIDNMVKLTLSNIKAKFSSANDTITYRATDVVPPIGWCIYKLWDNENFMETNSPFERVMLAAMNYTPVDYQTNGDLSNGDLYYYGVVDYDAIKSTWTEMQRYAVDLGTHMYRTGFNAGEIDGHGRGYNNGYQYGLEDGYSSGYNDGYGNGDADGYDRGYADASGYDGEILDAEYDKGYLVGHEAGKEVGYNEGFTDGKIAGESVGLATGSSFTGFFVSLFQAPIDLISGALNFDFLGINMLAFVKVLLTLSVVGAIVFVIFKFMK